MNPDIVLGTYTRETGLQLTWQSDYRLKVVAEGSEMLITANAAGLRSLAQHLLTLAQQVVPDGVHAHLEPGLELEDDSISLVIEKSAFDDR